MMKRFKQYTFLGLVLGLVLALTPTQSFASLYLTVGHRSNEPTVQTTSPDSSETQQNVSTDSGQLGSRNIIEVLVNAVANIF